jgi:hypothetical protein
MGQGTIGCCSSRRGNKSIGFDPLSDELNARPPQAKGSVRDENNDLPPQDDGDINFETESEVEVDSQGNEILDSEQEAEMNRLM